MPSLLLSGPAGAGKSGIAREELAARDSPAVAADFQSLVVAMLLLERQADGRYPVRPEWILPLAEYTRLTVISTARNREIDVIATNSDGDPDRRAFLLGRLGEGAVERVIDPGRDVVAARLTDPATGALDPQCDAAIARWYGRL